MGAHEALPNLGLLLGFNFLTDFSKEERAELHQVAKNCGLQSKSYGKDNDRFLVVRKKLNPFSLVQAVVEKGRLGTKAKGVVTELVLAKVSTGGESYNRREARLARPNASHSVVPHKHRLQRPILYFDAQKTREEDLRHKATYETVQLLMKMLNRILLEV
ncbi:NF-kappa-B-repressing factor [Eumeta japonica]|uniref:NF-kappa-B-repressing factor n=1 Tax=Eumeta variegata TaxID=151549 RepID=A0A4C1SUS4_EUMVA|nr:NF-kappa-B-repressing factor [Eumeta japonica]